MSTFPISIIRVATRVSGADSSGGLGWMAVDSKALACPIAGEGPVNFYLARIVTHRLPCEGKRALEICGLSDHLDRSR